MASLQALALHKYGGEGSNGLKVSSKDSEHVYSERYGAHGGVLVCFPALWMILLVSCLWQRDARAKVCDQRHTCATARCERVAADRASVAVGGV